MEFINENLKEIILAIVALFAGVAITLTLKIKKGNNESNKAKQKNNKVEGDMAGRDINK